MSNKFIISLFLAFGLASTVFFHRSLKAQEKHSFYSTWKLLDTTAKQQFVAGYLHGWSDAKKMTDIAIDYIKANPSNTVNSLEDIKRLYDVSALKPEQLVAAINDFYSKQTNKSAPLSAAVTAAKVSHR